MTDKFTESHVLTLRKFAKKQLRGPVIEGNVSGWITGACPRSLEIEGWKIQRQTPTYQEIPQDHPEFKYQYLVNLHVTYESDKAPNTQFASISHTVARKAPVPRGGQWDLIRVDNDEYVKPKEGEAPAIVGENAAYEILDMPSDSEWDGFFTHLYGLEAQISRVKGAVKRAIETDWAKRFHCALIGPPGCGKTDISRSVKAMFGETRVWEFDATATTAAGVIKELGEADTLPRVILIEEIEKAPEASLQPLLALLDTRGEVRKVTARSKVQRDISVLVIATVNNEDRLRSMQAGALYSRFMNKIHFREPDWDTLRMILIREITEHGGSDEWITPCIDYCQRNSIRDPRQVIALCLCGADEWLDGTYEKMLEATSATANDGVAEEDSHEF